MKGRNRVVLMDAWHPARVNPTGIHKRDWKEDLGNYKAVALTLVPGKVTGQIILSAITQHM